MADHWEMVFIDKDLRPAYYDDFRCLAADCKLNCCKQRWRITFDKKDYLALKNQRKSPELNARMENSLRRIRKGTLSEKFYGEFNMDSGVCPLLREDGLCALQVEKGYKALPFVCRNYPRMALYRFSGYLERGLSTSCEGVLSLLWNLPDGVDFRSDPLPESERKWNRFRADNPMSLRFSEIREWCVDLLQNRNFTLPERIMLMGMGLRRLSEDEDVELWLPWAQALPDQVNPKDILSSGLDEKAQKMFLMDMRSILGPEKRGGIISVTVQRPNSGRVEELDPNLWDDLTPLQRAVLELLGGGDSVNIQSYLAAQARYEQQFQGYEYFMENLMVSIFFYLGLPDMASAEELWKSYVNFCNLYACHRFAAVMSCREGVEDSREELFRLLVLTSRALLHDAQRQLALRDELFRNDSATLAHMAILLGC